MEIKGKIFLAPMAGVTDVGFRAVASSFGADGTVTEMLSARAMNHNPKKTQFMTLTTEEEKIKIAQIFGFEPEFMERAAKNPLLEKFDGIDINMGCPAPKILRNGEGAALMDNLPLASKIITAVKNATNRSVSVKFRKGNKTENFVDFARMCQDGGADFVTFHARTVAQGYSGKTDLEAIAQVKAKLTIPVVGNGDIVDRQSFEDMLKTGVDAVMVGRGSLGRPWIFAQLKDSHQKIDKMAAIRKHIALLREHFQESWIKLYIRKHLLWYACDLPMSSSVRMTLAQCDDVDKCLEILEQSFKMF